MIQEPAWHASTTWYLASRTEHLQSKQLSDQLLSTNRRVPHLCSSAMSRRRPAPGCKAAPSAAQPRALALDVLAHAAVSLLPAAQRRAATIFPSGPGTWERTGLTAVQPARFSRTGGAAPSPRDADTGGRPPRGNSPVRSGAAAVLPPPLPWSVAGQRRPRGGAERPPATWRGRSRPASGAGAAAFGRAMSRGRTALGAIAWLCLLVAAADGLRRRGPSVTAKVTPGRAGSGRSVGLLWGGPRAPPVSPCLACEERCPEAAPRSLRRDTARQSPRSGLGCPGPRPIAPCRCCHRFAAARSGVTVSVSCRTVW